MPMPYKKRQSIQIGVHQQQNQSQFVWLDSHKQVQFLSIEKSEPNIHGQLMVRLVQDFQQTRLQLRFVACVSPHLTWSKSVILPQVLNAQECEQQCRFVLQKELPLPLDELWFDYTSTPLKQGFRLDIHAIRREVANAEQKAYADFSIEVLDVAHHAILRAFHFILGEDRDNSLYLYQDDAHCFAIMESIQGTLVLQTQENLTALYAQFCQRFEPEIEHIYVYRTANTEPMDLPENWQLVETDFPFIALGNALWQSDLHQNHTAFSTALLGEREHERN